MSQYKNNSRKEKEKSGTHPVHVADNASNFNLITWINWTFFSVLSCHTKRHFLVNKLPILKATDFAHES